MTVDAGITEAIDGTAVTRSAQTKEIAVIYGSTKKNPRLRRRYHVTILTRGSCRIQSQAGYF